MSYTLYIGDYTYSSWSLRGWLLFEAFDIAFTLRKAILRTAAFSQMMDEVPPARLVPSMKVGGRIVWDSLAMAETLAESHQGKNLWPEDPAARAMARSLVAEMHSGFAALRTDCPMNLRKRYSGFAPSDAVLADCERISTLWALARKTYGTSGPWLFGHYSIADAFYAPVVTRLDTYDLPLTEIGAGYLATQFAHKPLRRWIAMAQAEQLPMAKYAMDLPLRPLRSPSLPAAALSGPRQNPQNSVCPFSGKAIADDCWAVLGGKEIGFCNPFCRDKAVADPLAWPQVEALLSASSG